MWLFSRQIEGFSQTKCSHIDACATVTNILAWRQNVYIHINTVEHKFFVCNGEVTKDASASESEHFRFKYAQTHMGSIKVLTTWVEVSHRYDYFSFLSSTVAALAIYRPRSCITNCSLFPSCLRFENELNEKKGRVCAFI